MILISKVFSGSSDCKIDVAPLSYFSLQKHSKIEMLCKYFRFLKEGLINFLRDLYLNILSLAFSNIHKAQLMSAKRIGSEKLMLVFFFAISKLFIKLIKSLRIGVVELNQAGLLEILVVRALTDQSKSFGEQINHFLWFFAVVNDSWHQEIKHLNVLALKISWSFVRVYVN